MGDLNITNATIDEKYPMSMIENISMIRDMVLASTTNVTLRFGNKYVSPLFALIIRALVDDLGEDTQNPRKLLFQLNDLKKNPEMFSFLFESGLYSSVNPVSRKMIDKIWRDNQQFEKLIKSIQADQIVAPHSINLSILKKMDYQNQSSAVIKEVFDVFSALQPVIQPSDYAGLVSKLVELYINAIYHSESEKKAYSMAVKLRDGGYMVAIHDLGIGIPGAYNKFRKDTLDRINLPEISDKDAIIWAMQDGTSTKQDRDYPGGAGLSGIKEFVNSYGGKIIIASNRGYYFYDGVTEKGDTLERKFCGTLFMMHFPMLHVV